MGGYATAKNVAEAVRWHERAVAQGSYISADNLGYMYMNGDGVRRDLVKATRLFDIAARQGDGYGIKNYMDIFGQRHVSYVNGTVVETGY
jgi:TPR repeat protein